MTNSDNPKPVGDRSHRTLKKMGEIDLQLCEPNNKKEIELHSWKRQKSEKWQIYMNGNTGHLRNLKSR